MGKHDFALAKFKFRNSIQRDKTAIKLHNLNPPKVIEFSFTFD